MESGCCHRHCVGKELIILLGRLLIAGVFLLGAVFGYYHWQAGVSMLAKEGIVAPTLIFGLAISLQVLGSISIILGYRARFGAFLLALVLIPAMIFVNHFWSFSAEEANFRMHAFLRDAGYLSALLLVIGFGAGEYSFDHCRCCHKEKSCHHTPDSSCKTGNKSP